MTLFAPLADPILPVFAILAIGFVLGRAGVFSIATAREVNRVAMYILIPLALVDLLANAPYAQFRLLPILAYALAQFVIFAGGFIVMRRVFAIGAAESVLLAYAGIFANNLLYGLPLSRFLFGVEGLMPITMVLVLDSVVSFGGVMIALQVIERGRSDPLTLLRIFARTPALIAIVAGLVLAAILGSLPGPVQTFLEFNAAAAAPVALFALGVVLSGVSLKPDGPVVTMTLVKLLLFPVAVAGLLIAFGEGWTDETRHFTFAAAAPAGAMSMSLAVLHGISADRIAQVMIWTGVLTLFTLAAIA